MAFNILPVLALASSVMAACPLSVAIVDTVDHVASIAVTNTGSEAVTVFKGNTVLSDHNTQDVFVADTGTYLYSCLRTANMRCYNMTDIKPECRWHRP